MARKSSCISLISMTVHIVLMLTASATPASDTTSQYHHLAKRSNNTFTFTPTHTTLCANYTTANATSPSSPLTSDCIDLLSFVSDKPGYWNISDWDGDGVFGGLVTNSTCQISLARVGNWSAAGRYVALESRWEESAGAEVTDSSYSGASVGSGDIMNVMANMLSSSTGYCANGLCAGDGSLLGCPGDEDPRLAWLIQRPQQSDNV